jgi:putative acyl-CoA dehydrogenase
MRMALAQAAHHARHRTVFQKKLIGQPLMRAVLADMALEMEGAVALVMRLCRAVDLAPVDPAEAARARLLTPAVKYWVCKTAPAFIYEAMECLGGNGYVEDTIMPRLYREAPVNAIWEGSGNVMCLDVLRALARDGGEGRHVLDDLGAGTRGLPGAAEAHEFLSQAVGAADGETHARAAVECLAHLAAAEAVKASAPAAVADAFARTRLKRARGAMFGAAELGADETAILLDRVLPA